MYADTRCRRNTPSERTKRFGRISAAAGAVSIWPQGPPEIVCLTALGAALLCVAPGRAAWHDPGHASAPGTPALQAHGTPALQPHGTPAQQPLSTPGWQWQVACRCPHTEGASDCHVASRKRCSAAGGPPRCNAQPPRAAAAFEPTPASAALMRRHAAARMRHARMRHAHVWHAHAARMRHVRTRRTRTRPRHDRACSLRSACRCPQPVSRGLRAATCLHACASLDLPARRCCRARTFTHVCVSRLRLPHLHVCLRRLVQRRALREDVFERREERHDDDLEEARLALCDAVLAAVHERRHGQVCRTLCVALPEHLLLQAAYPLAVHGARARQVAQVGHLERHLQHQRALLVV
eukprot:351461-Chlamydomonas_euryale.AAC.2